MAEIGCATCSERIQASRGDLAAVIMDISGCHGTAGEPDLNGGTYCLIRDLILNGNVGFDARTLEQFAAVKRFKHALGINGQDGGWRIAWDEWVKKRVVAGTETSYAKMFAQVYQPGMKCDEIYDKMFPGSDDFSSR